VSGARALVIVALAGSALAACGDDLPRLNVMAGGTGGTSVGGTGGAGAAGGRGGRAAGGSVAGMGGRGGAGGVAVGGSGGRGGAAGTGGAAGAGGGGRGGSGGAAASAGRGGGGAGGGTTDGGAGAGGTGGWGPMTPGYSGCSQPGGVDRIRVSKVVSTSGLCFDVNIWLTTKPPPAGLTLPKDWSLMGAVARPCTGAGGVAGTGGAGGVAGTTASGPTTEPSAVTGSIRWAPQIGFTLPPVVNVELTLTFAAVDAGLPASETLNAQNVDIRSACPR